jgi:hypothetical protein
MWECPMQATGTSTEQQRPATMPCYGQLRHAHTVAFPCLAMVNCDMVTQWQGHSVAFAWSHCGKVTLLRMFTLCCAHIVTFPSSHCDCFMVTQWRSSQHDVPQPTWCTARSQRSQNRISLGGSLAPSPHTAHSASSLSLCEQHTAAAATAGRSRVIQHPGLHLPLAPRSASTVLIDCCCSSCLAVCTPTPFPLLLLLLLCP